MSVVARAVAEATIVLVHGSWIGPECWRPVEQLLADRELATRVVDRTDATAGGRIIGDTPTNVARVRRVLDELAGPVLLCGHSAGCGIVTRAACDRPQVRALVYIAGFMTRGAETPLDLGGPPGPRFRAAMRRVDDETVELDEHAAADLFFHDCPVDVARGAARELHPQQLGSRRGRDVYGSAWQDRPSTYVVCGDDRALSAVVQRSVARRAAHAREWHTGHVPQLSRPELVASLLEQHARRLR